MSSRTSPLGELRHRATPQPASSGLLVAVLELFEAWAERRRQRCALLELSDALLKDIGLVRSEAEREAHKPFWRR